jgi:hypothetical protein
MELKNLEIGNQNPPIVYDLAGDLQACCGGPDFRLRLGPMHFQLEVTIIGAIPSPLVGKLVGINKAYFSSHFQKHCCELSTMPAISVVKVDDAIMNFSQLRLCNCAFPPCDSSPPWRDDPCNSALRGANGPSSFCFLLKRY